MKHFFEQDDQLSPQRFSELLKAAKQELKEKPMLVSEMSTKTELMCFNSSTIQEFVPKGMDSFILTKGISVGQEINTKYVQELKEVLKSSSRRILAILFGNIQTKNIKDYFELLFYLDFDYEYPPLIIFHFSDDELLQYLSAFLDGKEGSTRKVDVFDDIQPNPWSILSKPGDLMSVAKGERKSVILDRSFFSDIHLKITENFKTKVYANPYGKLRSMLGHFNKKKNQAGMVIRSLSSMYLKWENIAGLKISSSQSKYMLGVSINGEYIPTPQFITKDVGQKVLKKEDIDYFKCRVGGQAVDVTPEEITSIEVNLDTQQIIMTRGVTPKDNHVDRYKKLRLHKNEKMITVDRVVSFNRGESNFEMIQMILGARYAEVEKVRNIRRANFELEFLTSKNVMSGDLTSQLVMSSLRLLGILPLEACCIGFSPEDVKNSENMRNSWKKWYDGVCREFKNILDVNQTPYFNEHNFNRLSKNMRAFLEIEDIHEIEIKQFEELIHELKELTLYMDDFFQLDVYNKYQDDMECENPNQPQEKEEAEAPEEESSFDSAKFAMDDKTKNFIGENFSFFKKRDLIQNVQLNVEKMLFYVKHVKNFAEDPKFEPELIVYRDKNQLVQNFKLASYPAAALTSALNPDIIKLKDKQEELFFVQFMRNFTEKVHEKAQELNQSFHHQYKHTLAELDYHLSEQRQKLEKELEFLENPENREEVYNELLKKITAIFHKQLDMKKQNITNLESELDEISLKKKELHQELEGVLDQKLTEAELKKTLDDMPERLSKERKKILEEFQPQKSRISNLYNAYNKLYNANVVYFKKVLGYTNEFSNAILIRRRQQLVEKLKTEVDKLFSMSPEDLENIIMQYNQERPDLSGVKDLQKNIEEQKKKLKDQTEDLRRLSVKNLFLEKGKEQGDLSEYLAYFKTEVEKLTGFVDKLKGVYENIKKNENQLFLRQEEMVALKIKHYRSELLIKISKMIFNDPTCTEKVDKALSFKDQIPAEIKKELSQLRSQMNEAFTGFSEKIGESGLQKAQDFDDLIDKANSRDRINFMAKELVNYTQGIAGLKQEIEGEKKDLEFLASQEDKLEKVAMSKSLPSTTTLIKTQYLPLIDREKKTLSHANKFLAEIISKQNEVKKELVKAYFDQRHGFQQFVFGNYCTDNTKSVRDHTEKNINATMSLLAEKYQAGCAPAQTYVDKIGLKKVDLVGIEGIKGRIAHIWTNQTPERVLYLPPYLSMEQVLDLCEHKEEQIKQNPKFHKSVHSLVLVYINKIDFDKIQKDKDLLQRYHQAIKSNIFINIDGVNTFNNRDSIYETCIRSTFGKGLDNISRQITQQFLFEV